MKQDTSSEIWILILIFCGILLYNDGKINDVITAFLYIAAIGFGLTKLFDFADYLLTKGDK
jgi:hypothetical protein